MDFFSPMQSAVTSKFSLEQSKLKSLNAKVQNHENKKDLMDTAKKFEGIFFKQLMDAMDKTVDREDSILGGGSGEDTFRGLLYDKISESIATRPGGSGFGMAAAIYRQLEKQVPKESADSASKTQEIKP